METMKRAMKPAILDILSISISSILGAILILVSFHNELFIGLFAYLAAIAIVMLGIYASKKWANDTIAYITTIFVTSLVCISFTFNATQILADLILRHKNGITSQLMIDFAEKYSLPGSNCSLPLITILSSFALLFAHHWAKETFRRTPAPTKSSNGLEKLCVFILWITSSPVNIVLVALLMIISLYLAFANNDSAILAAAGGPITIIGLFSTIKFTTIEKYLNREELAARSTGVTGPPISDEEYKIIVAQSQEAARKRLELELRSELTGITLTVFGTMLWAYGAYFPISWIQTLLQLNICIPTITS